MLSYMIFYTYHNVSRDKRQKDKTGIPTVILYSS
jgi:hypothetical protein